MIRSKEYCDICERIHGEESEKALIAPAKGRPGFPQMTWTFFRKGLQCLMNSQTGAPVIEENYFGNVHRLEFCEEHGVEFNVLLKAFSLGDTKILKILEELRREDSKAWDARNREAEDLFEKRLNELNKSEKKDADRD